MNKFRTALAFLMVGSGLGNALAGTPSTETLPGNSASTIEEIVVTAQRREQNAQDVGIAVSVLSAEDLRSKGITSSTEIADLVPGVHMSGSLAGQSQQFSIRGVTQNDYNDSIEAPVAVYVDDVYIPTQQGQTLSLFDVSRVEVLKGPQGTLFGRNATGGLVQFVVNKPTREAEGFGNVSYGRFGATKFEGALSGPLSDSVAGRISLIYNRLDNYWNNIYPTGAAAGLPLNFGPALSPCCSNEGGQKTYAGRLQLEFAPNDDLTIRMVASGAKQTLSTAGYTSVATTPVVDAQGTVIDTVRTGATDTRTIIGPNGANYFNPALFPLQGAQTGLGFGPAPGLRFPGATWFGYKPVSPKDLNLSVGFAQPDTNKDSTYSGGVHVDYKLAGMDFVSITNAMSFDKSFLMSATAEPADINQFGSDSRGNSVSQEFRLSGTTDALQWVTGLYYLHINTHGKDGLLGAPGSLFAASFNLGAVGVDPIGDRELRTNSTSLFGQLEYKFAPKWTAIVGARGINEDQHYDLRYYAAAVSNPYAVNSATILFPLRYAPFTDSRTQHLWAGKLQLEYRPTDGLLIYLGANRGVKAGSYNAKDFDGSPNITPAQIPYKPEELLSIEGGVKWSDPQHRYTLDASVFHYDYKDYQAFLFITNTGYVQNVKDRTVGAELQSTVVLAPGLEFSIAYAYLDATIPNYQYAPGYYRDIRPTFSSKHQGDAGLSYALPTTLLGGQVRATGDISYSSSFFDNLHNFSSEELPGRTLENASLAWSAARSGAKPAWQVSAYVKNIADKRYPIVGFDISSNCGCSLEAYGMPRTYGLAVGASF
jgi:iron complex outermembrane receptor protein